MLNSNINYKNLIAELCIITLGVAVALAADSWRENVVIQSERNEYIGRVADDLAVGFNQLTAQFHRHQESLDSTIRLLELLSSNSAEASELIYHLDFASQTGGSVNNFAHDTTYRDLISTGRLNLIDDTNIRIMLDSYYALIADIVYVRSTYSQDLLHPYMTIVGKIPEEFTSGRTKHTEEEISRMIDFLNESSEIAGVLRRQSSLQSLLLSRYSSAFEMNANLVSELKKL